MSSANRREFLQFAALGAAYAAFPLEREKPELILHNGNLFTRDVALPRAQVAAIVDRRFLAVGANDEIGAPSTAKTKTIVARWRVVS